MQALRTTSTMSLLLSMSNTLIINTDAATPATAEDAGKLLLTYDNKNI
jgi:hypothetical protein